MFTRNLERAGAIVLLVGGAGFILLFFYLHSTFGYPEILDHAAADVLPRLSDGGSTLHRVWLLHAALPLTVLVGGIASMPMLEDGGGRGLARLGAVAATLAAVAMMLGLLRWPAIHDVLAARWPSASADQRETYAAIFDVANRYLGTFLGELLGELALAGWFACIGVALRRSERRAGGAFVLVAAALVAICALRNVTSAVAPIAALGNVVLPLGLFVIAGYMLTRPAVRGAWALPTQPRS